MQVQAALEREQHEEDVYNVGGRKAWKKSSGIAGHRKTLRRKRVPPQGGISPHSAAKLRRKSQPMTQCSGCRSKLLASTTVQRQ